MYYWVEAEEGYLVNISGLRLTELAAAFLGEYFFSNTSIGDVIVHLAAGEAYHELRMRVHEPELHADWLDRRAQGSRSPASTATSTPSHATIRAPRARRTIPSRGVRFGVTSVYSNRTATEGAFH